MLVAGVAALATGCGSGGGVDSAERHPVPAGPGPVATTIASAAPTSAPSTADPTSESSTRVSGTPATIGSRPAAAASPPYPLVSWTLKLVDTTRPTISDGRQVAATRSLTTLVWAPAGSGRWPLVVFAHGFQVGPGPYQDLLESWAAAGFVVAAPEFPLTDAALAGSDLDEADINNQPADVRFVVDQLVAPGDPVRSRIDPRRVALAGHSDGAETALAAAINPAPPGQPAITAVIAMSVSPLPGSARTDNPPLLVTQGDADSVNPPAEGYQTWSQAASPKYLMVLHGGDHLTSLEAGSAWLPAVVRVTVDFLRTYLGSRQPAAAITADGTINPSLFTVRAG